MTIKCVAIDDEPLALQLLQTYAKRIPALHMVETFEDAISAIEYLNISTVDLIFLDIDMPDISGLDLARALEKKPQIIFTTAHRQFAYEGFQLEAIDYLLKPISFESFARAALKAITTKKQIAQLSLANQDDTFIYVHSKYRLVRISLNEIEYIESMEDYVQIHIGAEKPIVTLMTLKKILDMLPGKNFIRIHRSYVINTLKIKTIHSKKVELKTKLLPIGNAYVTQLQHL